MAVVITNGSVALGAATQNTASEEKGFGSQRLVLEIANLNAAGGNDVFVAVGAEAQLNTGRRIQPGQSIIWSTDGGYRPPNNRVSAIAAGVTNLAIYEEVAIRG